MFFKITPWTPKQPCKTNGYWLLFPLKLRRNFAINSETARRRGRRRCSGTGQSVGTFPLLYLYCTPPNAMKTEVFGSASSKNVLLLRVSPPVSTKICLGVLRVFQGFPKGLLSVSQGSPKHFPLEKTSGPSSKHLGRNNARLQISRRVCC